MKDKDIIMVANQPWDDVLGSNCKNIALELSKHNRVLHINPPLDRKLLYTKSKDPYVRRVKDIIDGKLSPLEPVERNIWVLNPDFLAESINRIPISLIHDSLNKRNSQKLTKSIKKAIHQLQFSDSIIFNDNVIIRAFYLKEMLKPSIHIYYLRDYLIFQPYYRKHGVRLEKKLIENTDIILANSVYLRDYAAQFNANAHYVGQGCELDIFNPNIQRKKPVELSDITTPIIGYIGYLTALRLDIDLIQYIANQKPEYTIVLVGPEDESFKNSKLHGLKNVVFVGNKPADCLPQYLQYFDVCINPQTVNELTIGNYPRKIDEYLAMGKPTVATKTNAMEIFSKYCYLASNKEEYLSMVEIALKENTFEKAKARIDFAASHNWQKNVDDMCQIIEENTSPSLTIGKAVLETLSTI
jgi:teichuronic acid biosynthesis glycosyltransferase TuaH